MKKSIPFKVVLSVGLSLYMALGPCLSPLQASVRGARKPVARTSHAGLNRANATAPGVVRFMRIPEPQVEALAPGQTATLMPDGRWLLIGGRGHDGRPSPTAHLRDARGASGQAAAAQPLPSQLQQAREGHTATLLPDGTVFVFGGVGASGDPLDTAELYRPSSQQFEPLAVKGLTARAHHTATLLTDGRVLLVGGASAAGGQMHARASGRRRTAECAARPHGDAATGRHGLVVGRRQSGRGESGRRRALRAGDGQPDVGRWIL
jgi:hypothetical protein